MFSGPDFLYVDQFFPRAAVYVSAEKKLWARRRTRLRIANLSGALGKSGKKRDEVVAQHDVLHHTRYEGRSARAESERRAADSLHLHRSRGQIDHKRLVRIAQQRRRI